MESPVMLKKHQPKNRLCLRASFRLHKRQMNLVALLNKY